MSVKSHREALSNWALVHEAVNQLDEGISVVDDDLRMVFFNDRFVDLLQLPKKFVYLGANLEDLLQFRAERGDYGPGDAETHVREQTEQAQGFQPEKSEFVRPDGVIVEVVGNSLPTGGFINTYTDITELRRANDEIRLASEVLKNASETVVVCDAKNTIVSVNPAFAYATGYRADEVIGKKPRFLRSGVHDQAFYGEIWKSLAEDGKWQGELWYRRKDGSNFAAHLSISTIRNGAGEIANFVSISSDITDRKIREEHTWRRANFDSLTNLPNKEMFLDRLSQALQRAEREGRMLALMFVDLDGFKAVNDTLGHAAGDAALKEAAERIKGCLRAGDTVARLQGDEFTVLTTDLEKAAHAMTVAQKVLNALAQPYSVEGLDTNIQASIGVSVYPADGRTPEVLLHQADKAMYAAKNAGKNTVKLADPENYPIQMGAAE